jgi:uncharacterized protein (TIGR00645 family)
MAGAVSQDSSRKAAKALRHVWDCPARIPVAPIGVGDVTPGKAIVLPLRPRKYRADPPTAKSSRLRKGAATIIGFVDPQPHPFRNPTMKSLELFVERIILSSRWILVAFYLGLVAALAVYAVSFAGKFLKVAQNAMTYSEAEMILAMLGLIDAALVASLIVMVMISGYENFVSRFDENDAEVSFLGKLDSGSLKIKVASSIVAISSIHLLQVFLNANQYDNVKLIILTGIHIAFVVSALLLGVLEQIMSKLKTKDDAGK